MLLLNWIRVRHTIELNGVSCKRCLPRWVFTWEVVELVGRCIFMVRYSFQINGSVVSSLIPQRGIRQGDPLSPYFFVLTVQELSVMINGYVADGLIWGLKIVATIPVISYLFFADDTLLFFRATELDGCEIQKYLTSYEQASVHLINYDKSAITLSPTTPVQVAERFKSLLSILFVAGHSLYLGLNIFTTG